MNRNSNLLSWRFRLHSLIRRRLLQWAVVWSIALLASLGWWQMRVHSVQVDAERVALMETRYSPVIQMQAENEQIKRQLNDMHSHQSLLTRLTDEQIPFRLLALVCMQVSQRDGTVRIESFKMTHKDGPGTAQAATAKPPKPAEDQTLMTLRGIAVDNLAVSLFVAGLRDSGVFNTVDLKSSVGAQVDNARAQDFTIECGF